jgi:hypothetical protein
VQAQGRYIRLADDVVVDVHEVVSFARQLMNPHQRTDAWSLGILNPPTTRRWSSERLELKAQIEGGPR